MDKVKRIINELKFNLFKIFGNQQQKHFVLDILKSYKLSDVSTGSQKCIIEHLKKLGVRK